MTYVEVSFPMPAAGGYDELAWTVTPLNDPTPDCIFWSNQFLISDTDYIGGYAGLQTNGSGIGGKCAIFSLWNASGAEPGSSKFGPPIAGPFGGEGVGYHCLIPFPWRAGRKVQLSVRVLSGGGTFAAYADDALIGIIHGDPSWQKLYPSTMCWTERYDGGPMEPCADHQARARFSGFRARTIGAPSVESNGMHPNPIAPRACPAFICGTRDGFEQHLCEAPGRARNVWVAVAPQP